MNDVISQRAYLVVDDEAFSRAVVAKMLKGLGASRIAQAEDGEKALACLATDPIDCVIADFNMPNMNGLQFLKALRTGRGDIARDLPVIMLTGNADRAIVGFAIQLDVSAFIVKPGSKSTLQNRLERVFSERRTLKSAAQYQGVAIEDAFATPTMSDADREAAMAAEDAKIIAARAVAAAAPTADAGDPIDGAAAAIAFDAVQPGDVLAEDLVINKIPVFKRGARLEETQVRKLRRLADLADLLGPIGDIKVIRAG